jgi:hypothetical protein
MPLYRPTHVNPALGRAPAAPQRVSASVPAPRLTPLRSHWIAGGAGGIVAARYGLTAQAVVNGLGTVTLPAANTRYLLPLTTTLFDESASAAFTLADQVVQIQQTGRYRMTLTLDWAARYLDDLNLRTYGILRAQQGDGTPGTSLPALTELGATDGWDAIATFDMPGSDPPVHARAPASTVWEPGTVPPGDLVFIDVPVAPSAAVAPGDSVQLALSTLTSAVLGPAVDRLRLVGRVEPGNVVRVMLQNLGMDPVTVPSGALRVMGVSVIAAIRGRSTDGWLTVQTAQEVLYAGEQVFGYLSSGTAGDFVQVTNQSFFQIEKIG